jgi:uncharacterized membrane protein YdbT with pleckstrin-like domain
MAYPRRLLADGERVELDLHPHARALARPVLTLLVVVPLAAFVAARVPSGAAQAPLRVVVAALAVGLLLVLAVGPFLRWVTTHYVVTNRRLVTRHGVLARSGRDVPLFRVTDITFEQGLVQRLLGSGTLVVETGGERGDVVLLDVPHVEAVQGRLNELADDLGPVEEDAYDVDPEDDGYDLDPAYDGYDLDPAYDLGRAGGPERP